MATILQKDSSVVVINLFEAPDQEGQQQIIHMLDEITEQAMIRLDGFVSANLHRSIVSPIGEKLYVANYAQWANLDAVKAMMRNSQAREHMAEITAKYARTGALFTLEASYGTATELEKGSGVAVINLFEVSDEEGRQHVTQLLNEITEQVMLELDGFVSANLHHSIVSPIGEKMYVANYAQWTNLDAVKAMMRNPQAREHMEEITAKYPRTGALFTPEAIYAYDTVN